MKATDIMDATGLDIQWFTPAEGALVARISGNLDFSTGDEFRTRFQETLAKERPRSLLVDMGEVAYMSSMGLGAILSVHAGCRKTETSLMLYDVRPAVQRVFEVSKLNFSILDPTRLEDDSPFQGYILSQEPEREKRRKRESAQIKERRESASRRRRWPRSRTSL